MKHAMAAQPAAAADRLPAPALLPAAVLARAAPLLRSLLLAAALVSHRAHGTELNLAALSCAKYENEVLASVIPGTADPIDTVMWLFGFAVAKSGERVMYGDSLTAFGFALDAECKANPAESLLDAVAATKSRHDNPMDLTRLDCQAFEARHRALRKSDPESANTLTMWLFGYASGASGSHVLDATAVDKFDAGLEGHCGKHPQDSVFDALTASNPALPRPAHPPLVQAAPGTGASTRAAPAGAAPTLPVPAGAAPPR